MASVLALAGVMIATFVSASQEQTPPKLTVKVSTDKVKPGATVKGVATVEFAEGLHGYQNPPLKDYQIPVKLESDTKGITIKPAYPKGEVLEVAGDQAAVYHGKVEIPFTFVAPKTVGASTVKVKFSYQQCNDSNCWPPSAVSATVKVTVAK